MDIQGFNLPGYKVNKYRIVLNPHADLQDKIATTRKNFNEAFGIDKKHSLKANLPLVLFTQHQLMEERIIQHLHAIALGYPPFKVELKDFGSYPTHRIFINVTTKIPIQNLTKKIRSSAGRLMKLDKDNKPHFLTDPIMHIASRLIPWQYEKGWLAYSNKEFSGRFIADAMLLLKQAEGERGWQIVQRFEFQNMPVDVKQGELFI